MNKLRFKPSDWWYLPPGIAGGFFFLVTALFHPMAAVIFLAVSIPVGFIAAFLVLVVAEFALNIEEAKAKKWGLIAMAWVSVIAMYVLSGLFWCELIGC